MAVKTKYIAVYYDAWKTILSAATSAYQQDKGIVLVLNEIDLPEDYVLEENCSFDSQEYAVTSAANVEDGKIYAPLYTNVDGVKY